MNETRRKRVMTSELKDPFERIDVDTAKAMLEEGDVTLIDVREPQEWAQGHIPGNKLVPLMTLMSNPREHIPEGPVIFYCAEGVRSALACEVAAAIGRKHLYNLEGGIKAWQAKGYPVEK